jgi:hypothetical protein
MAGALAEGSLLDRRDGRRRCWCSAAARRRLDHTARRVRLAAVDFVRRDRDLHSISARSTHDGGHFSDRFQTLSAPPELASVGAAEGAAPRQLTFFNRARLASTALGRAGELTYSGAGGEEVQVRRDHGWHSISARHTYDGGHFSRAARAARSRFT